MKACDIVVHTSTEPEPCARAAIEGQLAGKPVIVAAAGGMFEVVPDDSTGRTVPPGDVTGLARTIQEILENPKMAAEMAVRGQTHARKEFSPEASMTGIRQAIDQAVSQGQHST